MKCPVRKRIDADHSRRAQEWARFLQLCQQARDFGYKGIIREAA